MSITINREALLSKISVASRFTLSKISAISSLQGGHLRIEKNTLTITSTNLKDFFTTNIPISTDQNDVSIVVDIKKIAEYLSLLREETVDLTVSNTSLDIQTKKTKGTFDIIPAKDFPAFPVVDGEKKLLKAAHFLHPLPYALFSSSNDESRPVLSGVRLSGDGEELTLASTDGFRLSIVTVKSGEKIKTCIIASDVLRDVLKLSEGKDGCELIFGEDGKGIEFVLGDMRVYSQLIEGEFPPFDKVIPRSTSTQVTIEKDEFVRSLKLAAVLSTDFSNVVVLDVGKEDINIRPRSGGGKDSTINLEAKVVGEPLRISFNGKFLMDFLSMVSSGPVDFEATTSNSPVIFKQQKNKSFLHIIMPIRTEETDNHQSS